MSAPTHRSKHTGKLAEHLLEWLDEGDYYVAGISEPSDNFERIEVGEIFKSAGGPVVKFYRVTIEEITP